MAANVQLLMEELSPSECNLITESSNDGKDIWLNGIMMQASICNRNKRVYPISEIAAAVQTAKELIKESRSLMGELDHPSGLSINLDRVSHIITEIDMNGMNAIGKAKLLNTPMGLIGKELVKAGVALGVSSRGAGTVTESGNVSGYQFVTIDLVARPSAQNAYPSTVYESLESTKNGKHIMELSEAVRTDPAAQKFFKDAIMKWLNTGIFAKK